MIVPIDRYYKFIRTVGPLLILFKILNSQATGKISSPAFWATQQSSWNGYSSSCIILDVESYVLTGIIKAMFLDSIPWRAEVLLSV